MGSAFCVLHNAPRIPSGAVGRAKAGMHSLAPAPKKHVLCGGTEPLCSEEPKITLVQPS